MEAIYLKPTSYVDVLINLQANIPDTIFRRAMYCLATNETASASFEKGHTSNSHRYHVMKVEPIKNIRSNYYLISYAWFDHFTLWFLVERKTLTVNSVYYERNLGYHRDDYYYNKDYKSLHLAIQEALSEFTIEPPDTNFNINIKYSHDFVKREMKAEYIFGIVMFLNSEIEKRHIINMGGYVNEEKNLTAYICADYWVRVKNSIGCRSWEDKEYIDYVLYPKSDRERTILLERTPQSIIRIIEEKVK